MDGGTNYCLDNYKAVQLHVWTCSRTIHDESSIDALLITVEPASKAGV